MFVVSLDWLDFGLVLRVDLCVGWLFVVCEFCVLTVSGFRLDLFCVFDYWLLAYKCYLGVVCLGLMISLGIIYLNRVFCVLLSMHGHLARLQFCLCALLMSVGGLLILFCFVGVLFLLLCCFDMMLLAAEFRVFVVI